jgi:hypothetical protein
MIKRSLTKIRPYILDCDCSCIKTKSFCVCVCVMTLSLKHIATWMKQMLLVIPVCILMVLFGHSINISAIILKTESILFSQSIIKRKSETRETLWNSNYAETSHVLHPEQEYFHPSVCVCVRKYWIKFAYWSHSLFLCDMHNLYVSLTNKETN